MNSSLMPFVVGALVIAVGVLGYVVYDMTQKQEASITIELPKLGN